MKKLVFLIVFAVLISTITLFSFWAGRQACMRMMTGTGVGFSQNWYASLNLNPEQKADLKQLESQFQEEANSICMNICRERMNLVDIMADKESNSSAIHKKIEEIGAMQIGLEKKIIDHILEIKKRLTQEQREVYLNRLHRELRKSIQQSGFNEILGS